MSDPAKKSEGEIFEKDQVVKIINSVIGKIEKTGDLPRVTIYNEIAELKKIIDDARAAISSSGAGEIKGKHINTATDELDEVVKATADATGTIMDSCEVIQEQAAKAGGEVAEAIDAEVIKVFEACSFQDITGQRITKVVSSLKAIEEKVEKLIDIMGTKPPAGEGGVGEEDTRSEDEKLLNGPQLTGDAMSQEDVDALLDELFD